MYIILIFVTLVVILFVVFILFIINLGSSTIPTIEDSLRIAKMSPISNYRIKDSSYSESMSDYLKSYTLVISKSDYTKLQSEIKAKPFFIEYDSLALPKFAYDIDIDWSKTTESAFSQKGGVFYDRLDPKLGEVIRILLKNDSLLIIEFQKL